LGRRKSVGGKIEGLPKGGKAGALGKERVEHANGQKHQGGQLGGGLKLNKGNGFFTQGGFLSRGKRRR